MSDERETRNATLEEVAKLCEEWADKADTMTSMTLDDLAIVIRQMKRPA